MPGVYSTRFILGAGLGPFKYTVSSGKRAVIKMATAVNPSASAQQAVLYVANIPIWVASIPGNTAQNASGLGMVVNGGEEISMATTIASMTCSCHGYLLDV